MFTVYSSSNLLEAADCPVKRYAFCSDVLCFNEITEPQYLISVVEGMITFNIDSSVAPLAAYVGALSSNNVWTTLPFMLEICGYETLYL